MRMNQGTAVPSRFHRFLRRFLKTIGFIAALPIVCVILVSSGTEVFAKNTLYVSPDGNDKNNGALASPLLTLGQALRIAENGDTIILRGGVYREAPGGLSKQLSIEAYPGEKPQIRGSQIAKNWKKAGAFWQSPAGLPVFCGTCFHRGNLSEGFLAAGLPEQVFFDGTPLRQVIVLSDLGPGRFYVDRPSGTYALADDPSGHLVEISVNENALVFQEGSNGSILKGLHFSQFSPVAEPGLGAMVKVDAPNLVIEDNSFTFSAVKGLSVFAGSVTVKGNLFAENGMMGLAAWQADRLIVSGNRFQANNTERFAVTGAVSEAAGAKITSSRSIEVTDNLFVHNHGNGLWLDLDVRGAAIHANSFLENRRHGVFFEVSVAGKISGNLFERNGLSAIAVSTSRNVQVVRNVITTSSHALIVQHDDREAARSLISEFGPDNRISFTDNLVQADTHSNNELVYVRDFAGELGASQLLGQADRNIFEFSAGPTRTPIYALWNNHVPLELSTLPEIRGYGFEDTGEIRHNSSSN